MIAGALSLNVFEQSEKNDVPSNNSEFRKKERRGKWKTRGYENIY